MNSRPRERGLSILPDSLNRESAINSAESEFAGVAARGSGRPLWVHMAAVFGLLAVAICVGFLAKSGYRAYRMKQLEKKGVTLRTKVDKETTEHAETIGAT